MPLLVRFLVRVARLEPGTEEPGGGGGGLAADPRRQAPECVRGTRAGEDAEREPRGGDLEAPRVSAVAAQAKAAALGVVGEHAVAAGGEQPGHREVGRVRGAPDAPLRDRGRDGRIVPAQERALLHPVLDHAPPLVHGVRALAETEVTLAASGREGDAPDLDVRGRAAFYARVQAERSVPVAVDAHPYPPTGGVGRGEHAGPPARIAAASQHTGCAAPDPCAT